MTVRIDGIHYFNGELCSNPYHLATFFYESMWCLIVFIILWSCRKKFRHDGDAILTYAALYGAERMFVERLRGDSLYLIRPGEVFAEGIRVSEMLSFIMVVCVVAFFIIRHMRERKLGTLIWPSPEAVSEDEQAAEETEETCESPAEEPAEASVETVEVQQEENGETTEE